MNSGAQRATAAREKKDENDKGKLKIDNVWADKSVEKRIFCEPKANNWIRH
jgi:hypothetical protein